MSSEIYLRKLPDKTLLLFVNEGTDSLCLARIDGEFPMRIDDRAVGICGSAGRAAVGRRVCRNRRYANVAGAPRRAEPERLLLA